MTAWHVQHGLEKAFMCKHEGVLIDYVGGRIMISHDINSVGTVLFIQPVLAHKLVEEYKPTAGPAINTPVDAGQVP